MITAHLGGMDRHHADEAVAPRARRIGGEPVEVAKGGIDGLDRHHAGRRRAEQAERAGELVGRREAAVLLAATSPRRSPRADPPRPRSGRRAGARRHSCRARRSPPASRCAMARIWAVALPRSVRRRASSSTLAPPSALGSTMPSGCAEQDRGQVLLLLRAVERIDPDPDPGLAVGVQEIGDDRVRASALAVGATAVLEIEDQARPPPRPAPSPSGPAGRRARTGASAASPAPLHQCRPLHHADQLVALVEHAVLEGDDARLGPRAKSLRPTTSVSARSVSPMKTGFGIRTLS